MEFTNREMINHLNGLLGLQEKTYGELAYKISRNKEKLLKEYKEFDKARMESKKSYCELDEQGNIKQENVTIEVDGKEVNATDQNDQPIIKTIFLSEEKEREWRAAESKMLDDEKANVDIRTVKESMIFDSALSQFAVDALLFMIEDEAKVNSD